MLPDTQSLMDLRATPIDGAGIADYRLPVTILDVDGISCDTVSHLNLEVGVPAEMKGTHMSRFIEFAEKHAELFRLESLPEMLDELLSLLSAKTGAFKLEYTWFLSKMAPVSQVRSRLDIDASIEIIRTHDDKSEIRQTLKVPVTTLCPCSKSISRFGAHNQRSYVTVYLASPSPVAMNQLASTVESQASCEVYSLLKRADEKFVTEKAYQNPRFAEDLARDVYISLAREFGEFIKCVLVVNHESIHNHNAYARIGRIPF